MPGLSPRPTAATALALAWGLALLGGCELVQPRVAVVNRTAETVLLRDVSYNGCLFAGVLAYGEATSPQRCLPGEGRVHFQRLDAAAYCREQAEDETLDGVCLCDGVEPDDELVAGVIEGLTDVEPHWFAYQTLSTYSADLGEGLYVFEITLDDMEQDFAVPGPYGH